jgi:fatty acid-binding protein DegV
MINILTDSTADIPKDLLSKYHIDVIPMYVQLNGRMYYDGANITAEELFEWVKATGKYPTTSAPPPTDFKKFFDRKDPSIYIGVSGQLSATIFKEQYNRNELTHISIGHLDGEEEVAILKKMIHDLGFQKEILVSKIGCVLASHSGPKPLGIAYSIADSNV